MNALRDIKTVKEIEVRLQSNEVLVHLPADTPIDSVPDKIHEAGYKADKTVCLLAEGRWTEQGFLPKGWSQPLGGAPSKPRKDGTWQLCFERSDSDEWNLKAVQETDFVPQLGAGK